MSPDRVGGRRRGPIRVAFVLILSVQVFFALWGLSDQWTRGHNGWNGAAYHNAARNTVRWHVLFPLQYATANVPPKKEELYTHAPLALHLHDVLSFELFGDREASIRLVAGLWSVAALCMMFFVVGRLWDDKRALTAAAIYVALPINAIYTNMANHSAGFIFWALLTLYLYVRSRRARTWTWGRFTWFLLSFAMAASWDWPAYYVAGCIAFDWAWVSWQRRADDGRWLSWLQLGMFCAWVLALFVAHFALVEVLTGNLDELTGTFNARRALSWAQFRTHLLVVPELMFTIPVLGLCAAWIVAWVVRLWIGRARPRDLIPIAFLVAGVIHYWTFRWSAVVHSYWAWPTLPGVAVAVTSSLWAMGRWIRSRAGLIPSLAVALWLVPLAVRDVQIVPHGRYVGGSMWFFTPVRGAMDTYDSGRPELRLAERVKAWTDRSTGVELHTSLKSRRLEPRFDITLDRVTYRWSPSPRAEIPNAQGATGWVFVAAVDAFSEEERASFASRHPYRQFGDYFMLDLRREAQEIEIWGLHTLPFNPRWWLFHSAFEPPVRATRLVAEELSLNQKIAGIDGP
ncbi:MAG: glycosyltransferase family 39 protein [Myxococcales bacterium]|jgi:4-amino-4-deoxy-L-arabinose transferase-like glycosyltransferase